jgi:hypothetical protein
LSHAHVVAAAATGIIFAAVAGWRLSGRDRFVSAAVAVVAELAVYLWRASANMPQLNNDGINGYSANDWFAPVVTFVAVIIYADLRTPKPRPVRTSPSASHDRRVRGQRHDHLKLRRRLSTSNAPMWSRAAEPRSSTHSAVTTLFVQQTVRVPGADQRRRDRPEHPKCG